jgi:acetate kinase
MPARYQSAIIVPMRAHPVLVVNSGSSSVKFALFTLDEHCRELRRGSVEPSSPDATLDGILMLAAPELERHSLAAIGHRIVHGGATHHAPAILTDALIEELRQLVPLAPNHLPASIGLIDACRSRLPSTTQVACFDTAFHADLPPRARRLPIPRAFDEQGVRRYGFHGIAFTYLLQELRRIAPDRCGGRLILAHLGNGSSLCAVRDGRSIDTTMGFTPIGGVVMSSRAGDIDPGVVTHLMRAGAGDADRIERILSHESGLLGISGCSRDLRELLAREDTDPDSHLAVTIFCYEIRKRIGAFAAALGGVDLLAFSGGIGEHAADVRGRICDELDFLGVQLDPARNAAHAPVISTDDARVVVHVIAANEEIVIARAASTLLQ